MMIFEENPNSVSGRWKGSGLVGVMEVLSKGSVPGVTEDLVHISKNELLVFLTCFFLPLCRAKLHPHSFLHQQESWPFR